MSRLTNDEYYEMVRDFLAGAPSKRSLREEVEALQQQQQAPAQQQAQPQQPAAPEAPTMQQLDPLKNALAAMDKAMAGNNVNAMKSAYQTFKQALMQMQSLVG